MIARYPPRSAQEARERMASAFQELEKAEQSLEREIKRANNELALLRREKAYYSSLLGEGGKEQ